MYSPAVDLYIFEKPEAIKLTLEILRDIIFETVQGVEEGIKWNCPFYSKNGLLCYLNYEKKTKKVILGFAEGASIHDKFKLFSADTPYLKKIYFESPAKIPVTKIKYYLRKAVAINKTKDKNFVAIRKQRKAR